MSDRNDSETTKTSLEERAEAATDNRTLDEIEEDEKTPSSSVDSEVPSPDAPARDRKANKDAGKDAGDPT